ncbi:MAG: trigger factor [Deltaproteobacteria bacterium]|nr:trigger factor [Deltaproteobacteria bacterium]
MQVTVEDKSSVKKVLHIEIPEQEVAKEIDSAFKELKKTAKVKGFRPGKVPRTVLERMFKKDVNADVAGKLIQSSFINAVKEKDIAFIGRPEINPPEFNGKGPYKYDALVEVEPEVGALEYKDLPLKKTIYKVSDGEVNAQLEMLRKNLAKLEPIKEDRPAKEGDSVIIDYEGFKDGEPFEETAKTENFTMKIDAGSISKDFDGQVKGMSPGEEKSFDVTFSKDYRNTTLAGLEISFKVTLKEIREEILPDLDDKFAGNFGSFKALDELKAEIVKNLEEGYAKRVDQEFNEQIFETLISQKEFELPDQMVEFELQGIIDEAERSFKMYNMTLEQIGKTRDDLAEQYRETAEKQVRRHIILSNLIQQENLELTDEELEKGFEDVAKSSGGKVEEVKKQFEQNQNYIDNFKHALLEKKMIELIISKGNIEEKEPESKSEPDTEPETEEAS